MIAETVPQEVLRLGEDRKEWPRVRFGEVVRNVNDVEREPLANGLERFVGLEHLDPESLQIRRWGLVADGTTFTRRFRQGQVLFGKRRAYQRKAAVAEWDGICSGDILVFEAKGAHLLPELLPFIVQTGAFVEHALSTSAGSLSPRTRWSDLARFEFTLPPLEEQRRIAEVLWAAEETLRANQRLQQASDVVFDRVLDVTMALGDWPRQILSSVADAQRGRFSHRPRNLPKFYGGPYPFVQTGDVAKSCGKLLHFDQTLSEEGREISRSFPPETILMTIAAVIGRTTITVFETWCPDSVVGIVPGPELDVRFLEYWLRTMQPHLEASVATQTAQKNINLKVIRNLMVPVPSMEQQLAIVDRLTLIKNVHSQHQAHKASVRKLQSGIVESLLDSSVLPIQDRF